MYASTGKGVLQYNMDMEITARLHNMPVNCICVAPSDKVFIVAGSMSGAKMNKLLLMTDHNLKNELTQVFEFEDKIKVATYMTYLENGTLLITDRGECCIYALNIRQNFTLKKVKLPFAPRVVHSHPDGSFLLTSENDYLHKCKLSDSGEIQVLWTCENLSSAYGICVKNNGLIIVSGGSTKHIHLLTPQGEA